jgi:hypothetical protein
MIFIILSEGPPVSAALSHSSLITFLSDLSLPPPPPSAAALVALLNPPCPAPPPPPL